MSPILLFVQIFVNPDSGFLSFPGIVESLCCYIHLVSSSFSWLAVCTILNRSSMCLIQYAGAGFAHRAVKCCGWLNCDITELNHRFERQDRNDSPPQFLLRFFFFFLLYSNDELGFHPLATSIEDHYR